MDVVTLRWPADRGSWERLRSDGVPCLLLVDAEAPAPVTAGCLEDWVRVPAPEGDVAARVEGLRQRAAVHGTGGPVVDGHGVLRHAGGWVALAPLESRLAVALVARLGTVASRDVLTRAGWPGGAPGRNALDVHVLRLRRRIVPLGLAVRTVRSRGYVLEPLPREPAA